jgi:hypothetical protein
MHSLVVHRTIPTLSAKGEDGMTRKVLAVSIAFAAALSIASAVSAKDVHATTMTGVAAAVDQKTKTFSLKDGSGKETSITWTSATQVRGGTLKDGERVNVSVFQKDGKIVATSIRIASAKTTAKAS